MAVEIGRGYLGSCDFVLRKTLTMEKSKKSFAFPRQRQHLYQLIYQVKDKDTGSFLKCSKGPGDRQSSQPQ